MHEPQHHTQTKPGINMFQMGRFNHQQDSISCFKKHQDGLAGIDFAMWKLAEATRTVFFLSGVPWGEALVCHGLYPHVQMLLHWTKSKVTTFWDVLLNGCKFHKNSEFYWEKRNFLPSRVLDGMFDGGIVYHDDCLSCWTNEDGLLDAEWSWRNAKGEICKPYDYSPHFCKTVPNESVPSRWYKAGCNVTSTSGLRRHQHNDYHEFIMTSKNDDHQLNFDEFCNFKSQVTTPPHSSCPSSIVPSPWLCNS